MQGETAGQTEIEIVKAAQAGSEIALAQLYEKYFPPIYRFHYWQTNQHRQSAEDLTQDTFLEAARSLHRFAAKSSFKNWLYIIAKRQLSKWLRRKYLFPETSLLTAVSDTSDWIDPQEQTLKTRQLENCLAQITARERAVLRCRYLQNLSVKETAQRFNLSSANVKIISHRALKKLQSYYIKCNEPDTITVYEYAPKHV